MSSDSLAKLVAPMLMVFIGAFWGNIGWSQYKEYENIRENGATAVLIPPDQYTERTGRDAGYRVTADYALPNGKIVQGSSEVSVGTIRRMERGDEILLKYIPPNYGSIVILGDSESGKARTVSYLLPLFFIGLGVFMFLRQFFSRSEQQ